MKQKGFTLVEVLTVVLIVGILASIALPMYTRMIERSRATEAMSSIRAINDSIYAYFTDREECPETFSKLVAVLPSADLERDEIETKFFKFKLGGAPVEIPGTDCLGVLATRINGGSYHYRIWHPYIRGEAGTAFSLQCKGDDDKNIAFCESLGLYRENEAAESPEEDLAPGAMDEAQFDVNESAKEKEFEGETIGFESIDDAEQKIGDKTVQSISEAINKTDTALIAEQIESATKKAVAP